MPNPSPLPTTAPKLISVKQAALICGVQPQTIRDWLRDGKSDFPRPYLLGERSMRLDEEEVLTWLRARRWLARFGQAEEEQVAGKSET